MLALLSVLSVARPVGWTISSFLLAQDRPRLDAALEIFKLVALVALLLTLGRGGPLRACVAVGIAFGLHALLSMVAVQVMDGVTVGALAARCAHPLVACVPMAAAVLLARQAVDAAGWGIRGVGLSVEIIAGALTYVAAALVLARAASRDILTLVRGALQGRETRKESPEDREGVSLE